MNLHSPALLVLVVATVMAQGQTIPEMAKANPSKPITLSRMTDVEPATLEQLTTGATLVIDATLTAEKTYLSPDERHVFTDYQLVPFRVLVGRTGASGQRRPSAGAPLTLVTYGGELVIEGVKVSVFDTAIMRLHSGRRYLLFLTAFAKSGKYQMYRGGAFEVKAGHLKSVVARNSEHLFGDVVGTALEDTVNRIGSLAGARAPGH